jgi:hypothetical protein
MASPHPACVRGADCMLAGGDRTADQAARARLLAFVTVQGFRPASRHPLQVTAVSTRANRPNLLGKRRKR